MEALRCTKEKSAKILRTPERATHRPNRHENRDDNEQSGSSDELDISVAPESLQLGEEVGHGVEVLKGKRASKNTKTDGKEEEEPSMIPVLWGTEFPARSFSPGSLSSVIGSYSSTEQPAWITAWGGMGVRQAKQHAKGVRC